MIKRTVFGALFVVIASAAFNYALFQTTVSESIVRGVAIALGYLAGVVLVRRERVKHVARQAISVRTRALLGTGVLLFVLKVGFDLSKTGPASMRSALGVIALVMMLLGAFDLPFAYREWQNRHRSEPSRRAGDAT